MLLAATASLPFGLSLPLSSKTGEAIRSSVGQMMYTPLTKLALLPLICSVGLLSGCADFIPQNGPDGSRVSGQAATKSVAANSSTDLPYTLVEVDSSKLAVLKSLPPRTSLRLSTPMSRAGGDIGVGDVLDVSIFEADTGGLFTAAPSETRLGNAISLPAQEVDRDGYVMIPYAGRVRAEGETPAGLARVITNKLKAQALDPQVVVGFSARHSGSVSVLGDVNTATHFSLDAGGERLLGALARAGGTRSPDYETHIELERDGAVREVKLSDITADPSQDFVMAPGDTVYVSRRPDYFIALGATGQSVSLAPLDRRIPFGSPHLSLADALARAGGLQDDRANPKEVFVFRYESAAVLQSLRAPTLSTGNRVPVVYAINLRDPTGLFYADQFEIHPEDIVYAANAGSADATKVEALIMPLIDAGVTAAVVR